MTTLIIVLFYLVLLLQEWFNKILTEYRVKLFRKESDITSKSKLLNYFKNTNKIMQFLKEKVHNNDIILIKCSNSTKINKFAKILLKQVSI